MLAMRERHLEGSPGYVIFFDNVRIDPFIKSFEVNLSSDGSIGSASFDFIYVPDFYKKEQYDPDTGDIISVEQGIENMTNAKIFIKNMFNNKYIMVFDGNIRGKNRAKSSSGYALSFTAQDYMTWLNRTIVPIAVPQEQNIVSGDRLKWKAQGIDIDNLPGVVPQSEGVFRGQTLTEFIGKMQDATLKVNKFYSSTDGVAYWDGVQDRIKIMGDIDKQLIASKVIDFVVTSSATFVNSMYVGINDIAKNLMFEFYQDRDGYIRIKPPFWNEHVLYDHIIEPLLIMSINENTSWSNYYTRTLVTGGIEEQEEDLGEIDKGYITPCGAYVKYPKSDGTDDIWSDFNSGDDSASSSTTVATGGTGSWLDKYEILSPYKKERTNSQYGHYWHGGTDFTMATGTPVYHVGYPGTAYINTGDPNGLGTSVRVELENGPYGGINVFYGHLSRTAISDGQQVANGSLVGYSGTSGNAVNTQTPHLHFQIGSGTTYPNVPDNNSTTTRDPIAYIQKSLSEDSGTVTIVSYGNNKLLEPSPDELKYGASVYDTTQPLIKFSNSSIIDKNSDGVNALQKYAKFLYSLTNSMVEMCNMQTVAMPWIRPGFNVWVDPVSVDKVYYVHSLTHYGSADGGTFTTFNLSLGRERVSYTNSSTFGAMGNIAGENLFISEFNMHSKDFGKTLESAQEFNDIKKMCVDFYKNESDPAVIKADKDPHFSYFYGTTNSDGGNPVPATTTTATASPTTLEPVSLGNDTFNVDKWPTLQRGSEGPYVTELQKALAKLGTYNEGYYDESFGGITKKATTDFQSKTGLEADGIVGKLTKAKIQEELAKLGATGSQTGNVSSSGTSTVSDNKLTPSMFAGDYTIDEIKSALDTVYAIAPNVVQTRAKKMQDLVDEAADYIRLHYVSEYNK